MNQTEPTRGVSLLIGDPKKAILMLSGPMVAAMMMMAAYNLVNAILVAGLGSDALAAVGFLWARLYASRMRSAEDFCRHRIEA